MITKMFFSIGILTLTSCNQSITSEFSIINNTEFNIDSLKIEPNINPNGKYISIQKHKNSSYISDMTTIPKTDGSYQISFLMNGKKKTKNFGYYTNGFPLEETTNIKIKKDTILIEQIFKR